MIKKLLWAASALALAVLVMVMFVGVVGASEHLIYQEPYEFYNTTVTTYEGYNEVTDEYYECVNGVFMRYPSDFLGLVTVTCVFVENDNNNYISAASAGVHFVTCDLIDNRTSNVVGTVRHGYSYNPQTEPQTVNYVVIFSDLQLSGVEDNAYLEFAEPVTSLTVKTFLAEPISDIPADEVYFWSHTYGSETTTHIEVFTHHNQGNEGCRYAFQKYVSFWNQLSLYVGEGYYHILIEKSLTGYTKWIVSTAEVEYLNESTFAADDIDMYIAPPYGEFCNCLNVHLESLSNLVFEDAIVDICQMETDELFYDLKGRTRSVIGSNIIPDVNISFQGQYVDSSEIGYYEFAGLSTWGETDLFATKDGFYNYTNDIEIFKSGEYVHDIYLIPLGGLDTGEFGGVVYDHCSLQPISGAYVYLYNETADSGNYAYSNKYGFYRFAGMTEDLDYVVSASKDGYDASIIHSFTFNESNVNETYCKIKDIWLLPEDGCPEDGGIPTPPPAPTPPPHEWTNEEIVSWLRVNLMVLFIIVLLVTFLWFLRKAGGSKR